MQKQQQSGSSTTVRVRRHHTRSRTGCSECRNRRVRCDEQHPTCHNCLKSKRTCEYPPVKIPLRERRAMEKEIQPWERTPWEVTKAQEPPPEPSTGVIQRQLILTRSAKNLNCVAIDMPLRSHELFQYFYRSDKEFGITTKEQSQDCLGCMTATPHALRSAVLIAGTHFAWNVGSLQSFEPTFLFHKLEAIRLINEWIASRGHGSGTAIIGQIATLSFAEVCCGEIATAETHLGGILAVSNTAKQGVDEMNDEERMEQELADRYFVLTFIFVYGLKSLLAGLLWGKLHGRKVEELPGSAITKLAHTWHTTEGRHAHYLKLKVVRMFPAFFNPVSMGSWFVDIDGYNVIKYLRDLTSGLDTRQSQTREQKSGRVLDEFWREGPASRLLEEFVASHIRSISRSGESKPKNDKQFQFATSWCGIVLAAGFYVEQALGVWGPVEKRIHEYAMQLFQRDVSVRLADETTPRDDVFLFWLAFLGHMSACSYQGDDSEAAKFFRQATRQQSKALDIKRWSVAKVTLKGVVWPVIGEDPTAREMWEKAVLD